MATPKRGWPAPRDLPKDVSIGSYHASLVRAIRLFLDDVKRAEKEAHEEVEHIRARFGIPAVYQPDANVERYSMVVQILVAMTMEAAIDMYAVVRFGEAEARNTWPWFHREGMAGKLREILEAGTGVKLEKDAELLQIVTRVFKIRNAFVHPKSDETPVVEGNPARERKEHLFPGHDGDDARASWEDLLRFFKLLHDLDPDVGPFIHPW